MCSQEGARLLVKAWRVQLMQYLADVWVEACFKQSTDRLAAVPVVNAKVFKRVEESGREVQPVTGAAATGSTQALGSGCPGDGRCEKAKATGSVLFHWKGYLSKTEVYPV